MVVLGWVSYRVQTRPIGISGKGVLGSRLWAAKRVLWRRELGCFNQLSVPTEKEVVGPGKGVLVEERMARSKGQTLNAVIVRINRWCIGVMMCAMFVMVFANVVTRYCLGFSIAAAEEIPTFLMIWVTYLGAGLALREGRLASIDVLQDRLPTKLRSLLRISLGVVMGAFFLLLSWYGVGLVILGWSQETFALMIPRGIPYLVVPIGAVLFVVHLIFFFRMWVRKDWDRNLAEVHLDTGEINGK